MKEKLPKKAEHILENLDYLTKCIAYFGETTPHFKDDILPKVREIEDFIKTRAINQKKTFKEIAARYEKAYEEKLENEIKKLAD